MPSKREILNLKRLELIKARAAVKAIPLNDPVIESVVEVHAAPNPEILQFAEMLRKETPLVTAAAVAAVLVEQGALRVEPIRARIYARPINVRMRLIEFEDGSHGRLWVRPDSAPMLSWKVWVKASPNVKGDWELHGRYNARGTRLQ